MQHPSTCIRLGMHDAALLSCSSLDCCACACALYDMATMSRLCVPPPLNSYLRSMRKRKHRLYAPKTGLGSASWQLCTTHNRDTPLKPFMKRFLFNNVAKRPIRCRCTILYGWGLQRASNVYRSSKPLANGHKHQFLGIAAVLL